MDNKHKGTPEQRRAILFILLMTAVVLMWIFWAATSSGWARWAVYDTDMAPAGAWGDSFGGFNALFGALGFSAVLATLLLQNKALRDQQTDQHVQRFEATFFELIRLMRELRSELIYSQSSKMAASNPTSKRVRKFRSGGQEAITSALYEIRHWLSRDRGITAEITKEEIASIYMEFVHGRFESRFSAYFRIIYTILYRVKTDPVLTEEQKAYYGNILRSQLTSHEISLLAINATSKISKDLFDLLVYFRMLKYLPEGRTRRILTQIFPEESFTSRD